MRKARTAGKGGAGLEKDERQRARQYGRSLIIALACVLLDLAGHWLAVQLRLPFWLDTAGLFLAASSIGGLGTAVVALAPVLLMEAWHPQLAYYSIMALALALLLRLYAKRGCMNTITRAVLTGFCFGALTAVVRAPVDLALRGGLTGNLWGDALYDMLQFRGVSRAVCIAADQAIVHIVGQQLCAFLACLVLRLVRWVCRSLTRARARRAAALGLAMVLALLGGLATAPAVGAETAEGLIQAKGIELDDYVKLVYDDSSGLPSSSVNALEQTPDGMLWIGGYAGLSRFDGTKLDYVTEGEIASVTALLTDSQGRLWIGTNDQGLAVHEKGRIRWINWESGLSDRSICGLFQARSGEIYVGTQEGLYVVGPSDSVRQIEGAIGVCGMAQNDEGQLLGVTLAGECLLIQGNQVVYRWQPPGKELRYTCVVQEGSGFWVGTSGSQMVQLHPIDGQLQWGRRISLGGLENVSRLQWDSKGQLWVCTHRGIGLLSAQGLTELRYPNFSNAVEGMLEDYEGNYWFCSSSNGVMKLSLSPFLDLYSYIGLEKKEVNAVASHQQQLWVATDTGLDVIDRSGQVVQTELARRVEGSRVRCVQQDSRGWLWVCAYGRLLCQKPGVGIWEYGPADGTAGDRFRCLQELPDGTMAVGSWEGITLIREDQVVGRLDQNSGLENPVILCLAADADGTLYAGSNGGGIYVIREGRVVDTLTQQDGLSSRVVMRMVPYQDGFFLVTSNALNWMENGKVRRLEKFPYFNNFDLVLHEDEAMVLCSRGIYVTSAKALLAQDEQQLPVQLYDRSDGLQGSIMANSWSYLDPEGTLYFCSNAGVERLYRGREMGFQGPYKIQISSVEADGRAVEPRQGTYHLQAGVDQVRISAAVCNYTLEDLSLRFYVNGLEQEPKTLRQSQLAPIVYQNIPSGEYQIQLQVLDDQGNVRQEETVKLVKAARMWENSYYQRYLIAVFTWMVIFATWMCITVWQLAHRRRYLELTHRELEEKVQEQARRITAIQWNVVESMASLIEGRDGSTGQHVRNAGAYVGMIAEELLRRGMYPEVVDRRYVDAVTQLAPLHDVGKIRIPDAILNKPGRLTPEEYEIMKTHAALGGQVIKDILGRDADPALLEMAQRLATCHHERWDGKGYPQGKRGTEIPLCARIMAVADVFDALSSRRVYKQAMDMEVVFGELQKGSGTQFQPEIVDVFLSLRPQVEQYLQEHARSSPPRQEPQPE